MDAVMDGLAPRRKYSWGAASSARLFRFHNTGCQEICYLEKCLDFAQIQGILMTGLLTQPREMVNL